MPYQLACPLVLGASLFVQGLLQAASFVHLTVDDFSRYWTIADTLAAGGGYQVWTASAGTAQGGGSGYWADLPVLPLLMLVSFALFGHTLTAAHVPLLLANIALPFVLYALYLRLTGHRLWAFVGTALILFLPFFQIYTLGASEPDPRVDRTVGRAGVARCGVGSIQRNYPFPRAALAWSGVGTTGCSDSPGAARGACVRSTRPRWSAVPPALPPRALVGTWSGDCAGRWVRGCLMASGPPTLAAGAARTRTDQYPGQYPDRSASR